MAIEIYIYININGTISLCVSLAFSGVLSYAISA